MVEFERDLLTEKIIACCFRVHRDLGPGFRERIYERALQIVFRIEKIGFACQKEYELFFENKKIGTFRCDLVVEEKVILELKSVTGIMPLLFRNQVISYLRASKIKTGLLVNFGNKSCDIKRISV